MDDLVKVFLRQAGMVPDCSAQCIRTGKYVVGAYFHQQEFTQHFISVHLAHDEFIAHQVDPATLECDQHELY